MKIKLKVKIPKLFFVSLYFFLCMSVFIWVTEVTVKLTTQSFCLECLGQKKFDLIKYSDLHNMSPSESLPLRIQSKTALWGSCSSCSPVLLICFCLLCCARNSGRYRWQPPQSPGLLTTWPQLVSLNGCDSPQDTVLSSLLFIQSCAEILCRLYSCGVHQWRTRDNTEN